MTSIFVTLYSYCSKVLIATNTLEVVLYDLRQMEQPVKTYNSNLSYNLRCVRSLTSEEGFATSCIEGRVSIGYFNADDVSLIYAIHS